MSNMMRQRERSRDLQDTVERGMWGNIEHVPGAGSVLRVRGTGTVDEEVPLVNMGYAFNVPSDSNNEMVMLSLGSDVNDKVVIATIARDLQHPWAEGTGGIQHPTDPGRRVEFNGDEMWLKDGAYKLGNAKEVSITVDGGKVTIAVSPDAEIVVPNLKITGNLEVDGDFKANGGVFEHNGTNVGDDHVHEGVTPGPGNTGEPI